MARVLITLPRTARAGEVVEIRTLMQHPMESGHRADANGRLLPRDIVTRFTCRYDGEPVFEARLDTPMATDPYLAFFTVAQATGTLEFTWEGDNGFRQSETRTITVT